MGHNLHDEQWIHEKESHEHTSILSCSTGCDHCLQLRLPFARLLQGHLHLKKLKYKIGLVDQFAGTAD